MWTRPVSLRRIGAFAGTLMLAGVALGCAVHAPAPAPTITNALQPLIDQQREDDAKMDLYLKKLDCLMEGIEAMTAVMARDEKHLTVDEALDNVDRAVAKVTGGKPWEMHGRLRAVTTTVYAHPNWTHEEADRQIINACLRMHGVPLHRSP